MNSASEDIKDILADRSSLGLTFAKDLYYGKDVAKPDNTVTIFDTSGQPSQLTLDKAKYDYTSVQIRVRNVDYDTGWALISDIQDVLQGYSGTWNGTLYSVIYTASGPAFLDWDRNDRVRFIINFNIQRR